ncbi:MAG: alpha/beta hydrolase [Saprospiraceae bacterium]
MILLTILSLLLVGYAGYKIYQKIQGKKAHAAWVATLEDTASNNVQILKDTIEVPYLGEKRTLGIYLPANYSKDTISYPVLYFLDGQSLYSDKILKGKEWQVDELLDSLGNVGGAQAIVVGIYSSGSGDRSTEYKPFLSPHLPEEQKVTGAAHAAWIATGLKAWVDQHYRTLPGAATTVIGGSSLGGLMAYYMLMTFPDVYGNALVFSPSFWVNEKVFTLDQQVNDLSDKRIYMVAGALEKPIVENAEKMYKRLLNRGMKKTNLRLDIEPNEGHWHPTWRKGFKNAFPWILGEE